MDFDGVSKFYGLGKSKSGGWLGEQNKIREEKGKPLIAYEDFEITFQHAIIDGKIEDIIDNALTQIDFVVGRLKKVMDAEDYVLYIGGKGNYRYDCAKVLPYKGNRTEKPILFAEIREAFINKYKSKIVITDGVEAEDFVATKGHESYLKFKKTGEWPFVLAYIDKDVKQVYCPYLNYDKTEEGIIYPTPEDCMLSFTKQLLIGDRSTDNIPGLPVLNPELATKYGLRKVKGLGEATAEKLLDGRTVKEMFEIVVEAYKAHFGEEKKPFTTHRGDTVEWNWLDYLQDTAILIYLQRREGEMYDIRTTLDKLKIDY